MFIPDFVRSALSSNNQFASGGMLLMLIGGVLAFLKGIPAKLLRWFLDQTTMSMTIIDEVEAFTWVKWWFQSQSYGKRTRRVDVYCPWFNNRNIALFTPAPGFHWFLYKKRPIWINLTRTEDKKNSGYHTTRAESMVIGTFGRNQKFLRDFIEDIEKSYLKTQESKFGLYVLQNSGDWNKINHYAPRPLESVILEEERKKEIIKDIVSFFQSESWYVEMGIPYHRGYLLYGKPGNGKTSLITGLSSHLERNIYYLKLSEIRDNILAIAMSQVEEGSIVVMEDIDCVSASKERKPEKKENKGNRDGDTPEDNVIEVPGVTLSGLLNVLDGIQSPHGIIYFMTTNYPEKLDSALTRPGRIDMRIEMHKPTNYQLETLYKRFFPEDQEDVVKAFIQKDQSDSVAEFQNSLMRERNSRMKTDL